MLELVRKKIECFREGHTFRLTNWGKIRYSQSLIGNPKKSYIEVMCNRCGKVKVYKFDSKMTFTKLFIFTKSRGIK